MKWESKRGRCGFLMLRFHRSTCETFRKCRPTFADSTDPLWWSKCLNVIEARHLDKLHMMNTWYMMWNQSSLVSTMLWQDGIQHMAVTLVNIEDLIIRYGLFMFKQSSLFCVCSPQSSTWPVSAERWDLCRTPGWRSYDWMETKCPTNICHLTGSSACEWLKVFTSEPPSEHATH